MFAKIPLAPTDPLLNLKKAVDSDHSPDKVDLGIGVYQNEQGQTYVPHCIGMVRTAVECRDWETILTLPSRQKRGLNSRNLIMM